MSHLKQWSYLVEGGEPAGKATIAADVAQVLAVSQRPLENLPTGVLTPLSSGAIVAAT
ncbi:hypothetical protein [Streptomyces coeruleorubidus]|uniref:hypothetical protein n=1 Tax=Streptomyces coeruleorubidus TaxID=116188 RepID=UPI003CD037CD